MGVRFIPGGNGSILVEINCFVHIFMYSYYMFVAIEETRATALTWKKHITQLQLVKNNLNSSLVIYQELPFSSVQVQFLMLGLHYSNAYLDPKCDYSKPLSFALLLQNLFMFLMFADFYWRNYLMATPRSSKPKSDHHINAIHAK